MIAPAWIIFWRIKRDDAHFGFVRSRRDQPHNQSTPTGVAQCDCWHMSGARRLTEFCWKRRILGSRADKWELGTEDDCEHGHRSKGLCIEYGCQAVTRFWVPPRPFGCLERPSASQASRFENVRRELFDKPIMALNRSMAAQSRRQHPQ